MAAVDILKKDGTLNHRGLGEIHLALAEIEKECSIVSVEELYDHLMGYDGCSFEGEFSPDWQVLAEYAVTPEFGELLKMAGFEIYSDYDEGGHRVEMLEI
jgi:hypothetical protein